MLVNFPAVTVLDLGSGMSKNNRPYARLKFLDESELEVYEVWCWGDDVAQAMGLAKGQRAELSFQVKPNGDGNPRFILDEAHRL